MDEVGLVVTGTVVAGTVVTDEDLLLGPDAKSGQWRRVSVTSVHVNRRAVQMASAGQTVSLALEESSNDPSSTSTPLTRDDIRRGMSLLSTLTSPPPRACIGFEATIRVMHHPNTIQPRYQPVIHVGTIRQSAQIMSAEPATLRSGDRAKVIFRFCYSAEYVKIGAKFIFREGKTRGMGQVVGLYYADDNEDVEKLRQYELKWQTDANGNSGGENHGSGDEGGGGAGDSSPKNRKRGKMTKKQKMEDRKKSISNGLAANGTGSLVQDVTDSTRPVVQQQHQTVPSSSSSVSLLGSGPSPFLSSSNFSLTSPVSSLSLPTPAASFLPSPLQPLSNTRDGIVGPKLSTGAVTATGISEGRDVGDWKTEAVCAAKEDESVDDNEQMQFLTGSTIQFDYVNVSTPPPPYSKAEKNE